MVDLRLVRQVLDKSPYACALITKDLNLIYAQLEQLLQSIVSVALVSVFSVQTLQLILVVDSYWFFIR